MDAEALHHTGRTRGMARSDMIHMTMCMDSGVSEMKSQKCRARSGRLREAAVRLRLGGVDQVGELDGVLDEEHRDVVADQVPVAFLGVHLDGEPADVAGQVGRPLAAGHGREADERRRLLALLEHGRPADRFQVAVTLEVAVRTEPAGVDHPLGDPLVVEVEHLLAEVEVFQQRRAAGAGAERVLVVRDRDALLGGQHGGAGLGRLVRLAARAAFAASGRGLRAGVLLGHGRRPATVVYSAAGRAKNAADPHR